MLKSELGAAHSRAGLGPSPASSRYLGGHNQLAPPVARLYRLSGFNM